MHTATPTKGTTKEPTLVGKRVLIKNLKNPSSAKYNGKIGDVVSYDQEKQRYTVKVIGMFNAYSGQHKHIALQSRNLEEFSANETSKKTASTSESLQRNDGTNIGETKLRQDPKNLEKEGESNLAKTNISSDVIIQAQKKTCKHEAKKDAEKDDDGYKKHTDLCQGVDASATTKKSKAKKGNPDPLVNKLKKPSDAPVLSQKENSNPLQKQKENNAKVSNVANPTQSSPKDAKVLQKTTEEEPSNPNQAEGSLTSSLVDGGTKQNQRDTGFSHSEEKKFEVLQKKQNTSMEKANKANVPPTPLHVPETESLDLGQLKTQIDNLEASLERKKSKKKAELKQLEEKYSVIFEQEERAILDLKREFQKHKKASDVCDDDGSFHKQFQILKHMGYTGSEKRLREILSTFRLKR